jgi:hypothetical protein
MNKNFIKTKLIDILNLMKESSEKISKAYKLKIDLIDFADSYEKTISLLFLCFINKDGLDLIYWWLYGNVNKIIYEKENPDDKEFVKETDLTSIEEFVDYIIENYLI